jgi:DASS family divalent anion:Na+ symporter
VTGSRGRSIGLARAGTIALAAGIWLSPVPAGLTVEAWRLFAIFAAAIFCVIIGAFPLLTTSVLALAIAVLTRTLTPEAAYAGFANETILLIVLAFLVARAVVKCGLGERIGQWAVSRFGSSTLGLSYSVFVVDALIAPAFPSSTARSGVVYPLAISVAEAAGARPDDGAGRRVGAFLMFSGMSSLSLSSTLWLTAMAANPLGTEIARSFGVDITFGTWLLASSVPTLTAMALVPLFLRRLINPGTASTAGAPDAARRALAAMGPPSRHEKIVTATFALMVMLWGVAATVGIDSTAVAFLGLGVLLATGVLTGGDLAKEGEVLATFLWFASLFALSTQLDEMGFMGFVGQKLAGAMEGLPGLAAGLILLVAYVLLHYLFVSQTAHLLALFGVFLEVGVKVGVPAAPLAFMLLFATGYFSAIAPQGSSANLLFVGAGYLSQKELYRLGALTTAFVLAVYVIVGLPWLALLSR